MLRSSSTLIGCMLVAQLGCASLAQLSLVQPEVELTEVQVTGIGLTGGSLNLVLDVHNPNSFEIRGQRMELALELDEAPFGTIGLDRRVVLPSREHTAVEVPLQFTWQGVGAGARSLLQQGSLPYVMRGTMWIDSPIGEQSFSVSAGGTVTTRDLLGRDNQ